MQLIFTQPTTEGINIKMSTQIESPINGNINEIEQEINQTFKIDEETIAAIEKTLSNGTETDVLSGISTDVVLEKEKTRIETETHGNKSCFSEDISEGDSLENINSNNVCENITNGTGCTQDSNDLECETLNLEMRSTDQLARSKSTDQELCLPNNSSNFLECLTEPEEKSGLANTDEPLCENNITLLEDTSNTSASVNVRVPANSMESDKSNADDFTINEEIKIPSEVTKDACGSDVENSNNEVKHAELTMTDAKYLDDIVMENEQESVDITTKNEVDEERKDLVSLDSEDVTMQEVNESSSCENAILPETEELKTIVMGEEVLPPVQIAVNDISAGDVKNRKPVNMDEEEMLPVETSENIISTEAGNDKTPIEMDKEVLPPVQTGVYVPNAENLNPIEIEEEKSSSVHENSNSDAENIALGQESMKSDQCTVKVHNIIEETQDVIMTESKETSESAADNNVKQLKDDASEINLNNVQKVDASLANSTNICQENKILDGDKNKDNSSMEIDDVETVSLEEKEKRFNNETDITLNEVVITDTTVNDRTELEVASVITAEQKNIDNVALRGDLENNETEDKTKSEVSLEIVLQKQATETILPTEIMENSETLIATVENKNTSNDSSQNEVKDLTKEDQENIEIIDEDDVKIVELDEETTETQKKEDSPKPQETKSLPVVCKLSNTLDILSDDEEEASNVAANISQKSPAEKQCINLDDDDDIMLIEEDSNSKDKPEILSDKEKSDKIDEEIGEKHTTDINDLMSNNDEKETSPRKTSSMEIDSLPEKENNSEGEDKLVETKKPLLPQNFLKTAKKNLAGMTRHELEDFCILRIVESIVDRSSLSDIKTKMKTMAQNLEDFKRRAMMMTKQYRDLQVVFKSVQEEQKKRTNTAIQPLKITRSVGMQVLMNDKLDPRRKAPIPNPVQLPTSTTGRPVRGVQSAKQIKPHTTPPNIPVPRKVPVNNSPGKVLTNTPVNSIGNKPTSPHPNGLRNPSPVQKAPEKRTHSRMQTNSVTVDLTDDEPPTKVSNKNSPSQIVRVVPPQNLLAQQRQFPPPNSNARKVYIPISGPQSNQIRSGQTFVMKNMVNPGPRPGPRIPTPRPQQSAIRAKLTTNRHPAPLPESMKQYTPPNWKALPPAPDLKLSKVENGIVISWKIDGYPDSDYESIASYQLYAYQETTAPPCTALWKKIGDVKALPLPMACTLTQFMAGFKYYFAVRAVDVRSRLGPFSLPGSILLLNKV